MAEAESSSEGVPEMVLKITEVARTKVLRVRAAEDAPFDHTAMALGTTPAVAAGLIGRTVEVEELIEMVEKI